MLDLNTEKKLNADVGSRLGASLLGKMSELGFHRRLFGWRKSPANFEPGLCTADLLEKQPEAFRHSPN